MALSTLSRVAREGIRLRRLRALEELLGLAGYERIAGVDEAGRGALAGPVVAAAVIVDPRRPVPGVDDSKVLPAAAREKLAVWIRETAVAWSVAAVDAATIDRINILEATRLATRRALAGLRPPPDAVVTDALPLAGLGVPCLPLVKGDALCHAVASASILAKVERDRLLEELGARQPEYGFPEHKGYGSPRHLAALAELGPGPDHRLTFARVLPRRGRAA